MSKCSHRYSHKLWEQSLNEAARITIYKCGDNLEPYDINNQTCTNKTTTIKFGFQVSFLKIIHRDPKFASVLFNYYVVDIIYVVRITVEPS